MAKRSTKRAEIYQHDDKAVLRPEAGTQAQFKKRRPPKTYRYDSALSPSLEWAGKAEHVSFDVPTLPLFVHERLSTKAILETLKTHERDRQTELQLFGDPQLSLAQQLEAYEHTGGWVNRLILGDSLLVMNSLVEYEGLGGNVQMIYIDPPYAVDYGSNFQPFVRRKTVVNGDDADMTREPEMVKAYRDTWRLGIHSYLTYLRDRLLVARDLLAQSGSVFVQIGDENVHHVRELLDEVFGEDNHVALIPFRKKTMPLGAKHLEGVCDFLLWYARDRSSMHFQRLYAPKNVEGDAHWNYVELSDGSRRKMRPEEVANHGLLPSGSVPAQLMSLYPVGMNRTGLFEITFRGRSYRPPPGKSWFTNEAGMARLIEQDRIEPYEDGETLRYFLKLSDGAVSQLTNLWSDTSAPRDKLYVVQTNTRVVERCMLMTTRPGDLVLDPTCGGGTTAFVAEQWGRRWITIDTSRVPLALTRQRLLSATYPWYELQDSAQGPAGGFRYSHRTNKRGHQTGGLVKSVTRGSVAGDEAPEEVVLVNRPDGNSKITRVTGPFCLEAAIPTPLEIDGDEDGDIADEGTFADRMLDVLRRNPVLQVGGNRTITLANVRPPAKSLTISAEAGLEPNGALVALVFGPENGAISERLVYEGAREAYARNYGQLILIGFAIEAAARDLVQKCADLIGIPAIYVQATPDLVMGDLLKTMRSSQIFSVTGLPDVAVKKLPPEHRGGPPRYQVELRGLDVFDPVSMDVDHEEGTDVPGWLLDTDYNEMCFHVSQAFFPRTGAWESIRKALKTDFEDTVWDHLAGVTSAPFTAGENATVAVKVIDDRGNELLAVKSLSEAR